MSETPILHRALTTEELGATDAALRLAAWMAKAPLPLGFRQVQELYDAMLAQTKRDQDQVVALGIAFAAAINERGHFDWVRVSGQWGDETCVGPPHKTIHCSPISMVQKRLDWNEAVDLEQIAIAVIQSIHAAVAQGDTDSW